jgi:hypothetical protein
MDMASYKLNTVFISGFLAVACGGGAIPESAPKSAGYYGGGPTNASAPADAPAEGFGGDQAPASPPAPGATSESSASGRSFEPESEKKSADEERPGLGTRFGESRSSRVSTAPFQREEPDRPFSVAQMFYNDEAGVRAMARRSGVSHFGGSAFRVAGGALTVRLLDSSGNPLRGFDAGTRSYVVGEDGDRYVIQIRNHTGHRVEAVASVDGLDVIDGRAASFHKRGYIVNPFATVEIDGFRRSFDEVAAFRFGSVSGSYAAQKGDDRNVGVIGVAFFEEAGSNVRWTDFEVERRHDADAFPGRFSSPPPGRF